MANKVEYAGAILAALEEAVTLDSRPPHKQGEYGFR